jgi:Transposase and inactivated derivatives
MAQSLSQVYLHVVFSTKLREPLLKPKRLRMDVHSYMAATLNNLKCTAITVGGIEDHVHFLCRLGRNVKIAELIRDVKKASSGMLHDRSAALRDFHWQAGYGAFSISPSHVAAVTSYIRNQEEHHRRVGFQDEYRRLLKKYEIEYDERYVWD